jgi:hypothetical protein
MLVRWWRRVHFGNRHFLHRAPRCGIGLKYLAAKATRTIGCAVQGNTLSCQLFWNEERTL